MFGKKLQIPKNLTDIYSVKLLLFTLTYLFINFALFSSIIEYNDYLLTYNENAIVLNRVVLLNKPIYICSKLSTENAFIKLSSGLIDNAILDISLGCNSYLEISDNHGEINLNNIFGAFRITSDNSLYNIKINISGKIIDLDTASINIVSLPDSILYISINSGKIKISDKGNDYILIAGESIKFHGERVNQNNFIQFEDLFNEANLIFRSINQNFTRCNESNIIEILNNLCRVRSNEQYITRFYKLSYLSGYPLIDIINRLKLMNINSYFN